MKKQTTAKNSTAAKVAAKPAKNPAPAKVAAKKSANNPELENVWEDITDLKGAVISIAKNLRNLSDNLCELMCVDK